MKFRGPIFFSILVVGLLAAAYYPQADKSEKEVVLMKTILNGFEQLHYQPKAIDNEFSEQVFNLYLDQVDGGRRFLTQEDIRRMEPYKLQLDEEVNKGSFDFFNLSLEALEAGLKKTQAYYQQMLEEPFDYEKMESLELDGEKRGFAANDEALQEFWRKYLKYESLERLARKVKEQEDAGEEGEKKPFELLEKEAREEVREFLDDWYSRMFKLTREDRMSAYFNTITHIFDPHSEYYKPIDKENFDIHFSGRLEGIGATLRTEGDYTKVASIVVGGPAWKQAELQENDVILKVKQEDEESPVDIAGMMINDVVQLIRGKKGTKVTLSVKKVDGTLKKITIERDIVILEEQFAKSLIFDGAAEGERIGYIYLPSFYADFQDRDGRFCSKDVAEEIKKLQSENVDGIILDLRNNGGGSLRDVVKMTGFFYENGPVVQVKSRGGAPEVLRDVDPRVQYSGPLIVMVNSYSASASEILAAALQDYSRAVIVGSTSTFGKGTVQRFVDLDRTIRGYNEIKPLGEIKLTTQKFYRVNGGSTQLRGVVPDIILPDTYHYIKTGERDRDYAMEWTEIAPVDYGQNVMRVKNLDEIKARSQQRVAENTIFQQILDKAKYLEVQRENSAYPLQLEAYQAKLEEQEAESESFDKMFQTAVNSGVQNLPIDMPGIESDESRQARNENWIETISKDVYIQETLQVMHDLISLN